MPMNLSAKINITRKRSAVAALPYCQGAENPPYLMATIGIQDAKAVDTEYTSTLNIKEQAT